MKRALFVSFAMAVAVVGCKASKPAPEAVVTKPEPTPTVAQATSGSAAPTGSAAAANDPWKKDAPKKDPLPHPLFWSIEKDGKTSYALGTIHVGIDAETRLPDSVWAKLDAAVSFAMETDLSDPTLKTIMDCANCSLKRDLGDKRYAKLEETLGKAVVARISAMKPMVAATMLSLQGLPQTSQMDTLLLARASNEKKPIVYLEKAQKEAAVLEKWMDARALGAMLDDVDGNLAHTKEMLVAYTEGDAAKMVKLGDDEKTEALKHGYTAAEFDASLKDMLYDRNASWIDPIEKMHAAGGGFIAVGAMHLVGPKSVLELLSSKGYKIARVAP